MIFEITSKIRRSTDIETIMVITANELMKTVHARHVKISLGLNQTQDPSESPDTSLEQ
jgi:hypothetical protein